MRIPLVLRIELRTYVAMILLVGTIPALAFSSEDPCHVAYLHADKLIEERACEAAANAGDAHAQLGYGLILWSGDQPTHDHRAALEWMRKSARQDNYLAQIFLGGLLKHKGVEAELRDPVEAYAWLVTAGDEKSARRLRATLNQQDSARADALASDYRSKYANLEVSRTIKWVRATNTLSIAWPGLLALAFLVVAQRRIARKLAFVVAAIVIAYASQYLAIWALTLGMNAVMTRFPNEMLDAVLWTLGLELALRFLAPSLGVWALYRFWIRRRWIPASAT